jgi:ABC-2 type transport system permease protein
MTTALPTVAPVRVPEFGLRHDLRAVRVVLKRELIRFSQDRTRMVAALVQPLLFLFVLGNGLSSLTGASTYGINLKTFLFPGILATSTLFTAMFSAVSIVWDREFGFLREMLVAPVRRGSIIVGKALGGATVATLQSVLFLLFAPVVGIPFSIPLILSLLFILFLLSFTLTAFGLVIAARIQQMQAVMGVMQILLLPLSFLSGALYPINNLPTWLSIIVHLNPITYAVHPIRTAVFTSIDASPQAVAALNPPLTWFGWPVPTWLQLAVVAVTGLVLLFIAMAEFNRAD